MTKFASDEQYSSKEEVEDTYKQLADKFSSARGKQMKQEMPDYFG